MKTKALPELSSTINYSQLVTSGDIVSVQVNIVTEIRNRKHLEALARSMLWAASLEEHRVSQMDKWR